MTEKNASDFDEVRIALEAILEDRSAPALNWAINRVESAIANIDDEPWIVQVRRSLGLSKSEAIAEQCLLVVGDIRNWRGKDSKWVRKTLKEFVARS
jgi:hypothetical protein